MIYRNSKKTNQKANTESRKMSDKELMIYLWMLDNSRGSIEEFTSADGWSSPSVMEGGRLELSR